MVKKKKGTKCCSGGSGACRAVWDDPVPVPSRHRFLTNVSAILHFSAPATSIFDECLSDFACFRCFVASLRPATRNFHRQGRGFRHIFVLSQDSAIPIFCDRVLYRKTRWKTHTASFRAYFCVAEKSQFHS